jgi:A/G-specific adenine glycosylase
VRSSLLGWYRERARDLPWRKTRDPYAIWVSEVMLQQTRVATVIPYFERWMARFPTLQALARANEDDVLHAWQGLGYYARARALRSGAQSVVEKHGGHMPRDAETLATLPGIGPYTAGAIASIAFGERAPIVDGNVIRVLTRLYALEGNPAKAPLRERIWLLSDSLVPPARAGDFNQSLMELGATVCLPKSPECETCPLAQQCLARGRGWEQRLPELQKRKKPTLVRMVATVVERRGRVLLVKVGDDAPRWAGMWQFPNTERKAKETAERAVIRSLSGIGLDAAGIEPLLLVRHSVTRYRIELEVHRAKASGSSRSRAIRWQPIDALGELALPSAHRRIASALLR